jgi:hypothetical protein
MPSSEWDLQNRGFCPGMANDGCAPQSSHVLLTTSTMPSSEWDLQNRGFCPGMANDGRAPQSSHDCHLEGMVKRRYPFSQTTSEIKACLSF